MTRGTLSSSFLEVHPCYEGTVALRTHPPARNTPNRLSSESATYTARFTTRSKCLQYTINNPDLRRTARRPINNHQSIRRYRCQRPESTSSTISSGNKFLSAIHNIGNSRAKRRIHLGGLPKRKTDIDMNRLHLSNQEIRLCAFSAPGGPNKMTVNDVFMKEM